MYIISFQWRRPNDETPFTNSKLKFPISFSKFLGGIAAFPQDDYINYPDAVSYTKTSLSYINCISGGGNEVSVIFLGV